MLFLALFVSALLLQLFFPWWVVGPLAFVLALYFKHPPFKTFFLSFLAIYSLGCSYGLYLSILNDHIMANRIGNLLGIPANPYNWIWIVLATGLPGGLVAGFAGLTGHYIKKCF